VPDAQAMRYNEHEATHQELARCAIQARVKGEGLKGAPG